MRSHLTCSYLLLTLTTNLVRGKYNCVSLEAFDESEVEGTNRQGKHLRNDVVYSSKGIRLHSPLEFGEFWVLIRQACKVQIILEYGFCGNRTSIGVDETSSWFMLALYTNVCFSQEAYWRVPQQHNDFELAFFFIPLTLPALFLFVHLLCNVSLKLLNTKIDWVFV